VKATSLIGAIAMQHRRLILLLAALSIAFCFYTPLPSAEKVVVSYPSRSLTSFLIPEIARQRGFFLAEGIEANLIYVRGAIDIKALVTGDVDYAMAGSSMRKSLKR
jgi:ABC-type nitrate/sulfonate/bicarbonate transport system substrate-binding protein